MGRPIPTLSVAKWERLVADGELIPPPAAAILLGVSKPTIYAMIERGDLRAARHPSGRRRDATRVFHSAVQARLRVVEAT